MSYNKMMRQQRTSIRKHKSISYKANIICSLPSDKDVIYPKKTNNIADYNVSDLTNEQIKIASILMGMGYNGMPRFETDKYSLNLNLFSSKHIINNIEVIAMKDNFGFKFSF